MPNNVLMYKSATPLKLMKDQMSGSKNHNAQSLHQVFLPCSTTATGWPSATLARTSYTTLRLSRNAFTTTTFISVIGTILLSFKACCFAFGAQ